MKITEKSVVTLSLVVTNENDQVVAKTEPKEPKVVLAGQGFLVPGLEKEILGHEAGDEFTVTLEPADAYGVIDKELIQNIDRRLFGDFPVEEGSIFEADTSRGPCAVVVKEVGDDFVVVDGNHPLAGMKLTFFVVIEDVREASEEELAHGHAHIDGQCPSQAHHCCCGGHHHHEEGEHHCCGGHHHHEEGEHHCCGGHHHHEEGEHHCCGGHHHHEEGEHHCCCGRHKHEDK